jgi:hypothetical protein
MISIFLKRILFTFVLSWCSISFCDIATGTTILTIQGLTPIEKINIGDYVVGYESNALGINQVIQISAIKIDTIVTITTNQEVIQATENQLFYDPCINHWIKAKDLTTSNIFLNSNLEYCSCHNITIAPQTTIAYKISTTSPHNFFISNAQILTHNVPPVAIGIAWAFGAGIKFAGITLGALFGGTMIGINLLNKNKKNVLTFGLDAETITCSGDYNPDPNDNNKDKKKQRDTTRENYRSLTNKESRKIATDMGYKEVKNHPCGNTRNKPVFTNGKNYISADADGHNGGIWKLFNRAGDRIGTGNIDLTKIIGG